MEIFTELTHYLASEISSKGNRSRKRSADAQRHFEYAITIAAFDGLIAMDMLMDGMKMG